MLLNVQFNNRIAQANVATDFIAEYFELISNADQPWPNEAGDVNCLVDRCDGIWSQVNLVEVVLISPMWARGS